MITKRIAIHVIHGERLGNSNWQMGQTFALASTSMAQEGHSLVFKGIGELFGFISDFSFK
ncbi:hypothetical protein [Algoriphagus sp. AK58]|uniref:hypothetical protein n=1 Tax=Algoriphagus sp. AK58 TaxID=1406877 RepID=UPI0016507F4F|nr:hypothetical protein [Algoriphagus sp. AK58]